MTIDCNEGRCVTLHQTTIDCNEGRHVTLYQRTIDCNRLYWLRGCCIGFVLGGGWGTKPGVFPCKVAAADNDRYLVCAAGAAGVVLTLCIFAAVELWLQAASAAFVCAQL